MVPRSLLREPLVHFLAIGAALFLIFEWSGAASGPASKRIVLTSGQIEHLAAGYTKAWRRAPTEGEIKGLVDDWVREEIAVREAQAAGLDRDDTVIRRRLRQKLEFLLEDEVDASAPADAQLQAWLDAHPEASRTEPRTSLRQVYFSRERRGSRAEADARDALARLAKAGPGARIESLGDPTQLPTDVQLAQRREVVATFGDGFAGSIEKLEPGAWSGPIASAYGLHVVMVLDRSEARRPDLASIRPAVERAYAADLRARRLAEMYERMLARYTVEIQRSKAGETLAARGGGGR